MTDNKDKINDILKQIPSIIGSIHNEAKSVGKNIIKSQLQTADLVTRDEFDEQKEILKAIIEKLDKLEKIINENKSKTIS